MTYDALVKEHYDTVAETDGASPTSTMADQIVREAETYEILRNLERAQMDRGEFGRFQPLTVLDVGCGNGYTLSQMRDNKTSHLLPAGDLGKPVLYGVEHNDKLREIASRQHDMTILPGDLRDPSTIAIEPQSINYLVCQRVLINLLDPKDQKRGLQTCIDLVKPGGRLLFIEVFQSGLDRLNEARAEWDLPPIPPAHHNLPLPDDFFSGHKFLSEIRDNKRHRLSTHFFVTRVLHELELRSAGKTGFTRNSHYVRFLSNAMQPFGEYAPLQFRSFVKER